MLLCTFSVLPPSLSKLAQVITWLEWQQSSGRSRRVPRLARFKGLIMFQISVLLQLRGRCWKQSTCVPRSEPLIAWHPPWTRRLFSVSPSSLWSINPPVPFNQRKTSLICASGSLVTGNWILQISLSAKEQYARILNLIYNASVLQVHLLMVISCTEFPKLEKPDNIWEESGPLLNVTAYTHLFFLSVFSSRYGSTLCVAWLENKWLLVVIFASSVSAESRDYVHAVINPWEAQRRKVSPLFRSKSQCEFEEVSGWISCLRRLFHFNPFTVYNDLSFSLKKRYNLWFIYTIVEHFASLNIFKVAWPWRSSHFSYDLNMFPYFGGFPW